MKLSVIIPLIIILGILCSACTSASERRPTDFHLDLVWNTGALPPQYRYTFEIAINSQGAGLFTYRPGYDSDPEDEWQTEFSLSENQLDDLYQYFLDSDLLRDNWKIGRQLMGGKGTSIQIVADGREYLIPSVSELEQADREVVNNAIDFIKSLIDQRIWEEM